MATVKGYLRSEGVPKMRGFFSATVRPYRLALVGSVGGEKVIGWNIPTGFGQNYVESTNNMAEGNELLFKVPKNQPLGLLQIQINNSGYPLFAQWTLEGNGGTVNQDNVFLYTKIRLNFSVAGGEV